MSGLAGEEVEVLVVALLAAGVVLLVPQLLALEEEREGVAFGECNVARQEFLTPLTIFSLSLRTVVCESQVEVFRALEGNTTFDS